MKTVTIDGKKCAVHDWVNFIAVDEDGLVHLLKDEPINGANYASCVPVTVEESSWQKQFNSKAGS